MTSLQFIAQTSPYGMNPMFLMAQIFNLLFVTAYILLVIKASFRAAEKGKGVEVPIWLFAIVLLPIVGAVAALAHYKKEQS